MEKTLIYQFHGELYTVSSRYVEAKVYLKLRMTQSKFSGFRKVTLRYQYFDIPGVEMKKKTENIFRQIVDYFRMTIYITFLPYYFSCCDENRHM